MFLQRSVRGLNPILVLTKDACYQYTYRPFTSSDPGWNRTSTFLHVTQASSPLDHGINSVTRTGIEPAKSPRSQRDRFACLRTRPCCLFRFAVSDVSGGRTRRSELKRLR